MIKITLEHGKTFGPDSPYGVKVTAIDTEFTGSCDAIFVAAGIDRLSKAKLQALFETLEHNINQCIKGYYGEIPTIEYPKIDKES